MAARARRLSSWKCGAAAHEVVISVFSFHSLTVTKGAISMKPSHLPRHSGLQAVPHSAHLGLATAAAAVFAAALMLVGCGGSGGAQSSSTDASGAAVAQQTPVDPVADSLSQEPIAQAATDSGREANYFRLTKDTRTCAAPACGGVYATTMNTNVQITCPNGETSATCYIAKLDTSALGYSPFDKSNGESVKVKGTLTAGRAAADGIHYGNLAVETVFLPVAGTTSHLMHHLYVVTNNGLQCATKPCLKYTSKLANRSRDHDISSFDFSLLGMTKAQSRAFLRAVNGGQEALIQVGTGQTIQTENGVDMREGVNALYMPVGTMPDASAAALLADDNVE
jgi:hypothetical protein